MSGALRPDDLTIGDRVRLSETFEGLPVGVPGTVGGFYRRPSGDQIAVLFDTGRSLPVPVTKLARLREPHHDTPDGPRSDEPPTNTLAW